MELLERSELGAWQLPNWAAHLLIFEKSEKCPFWVENSNRSKIAQKRDLTKILDSRLVWDEKNDFFWKIWFSTLLEDFPWQIAYSALPRILEFGLYFRLREVLWIYAVKVPKIANFLYFEKNNLNWRHIWKWAKNLFLAKSKLIWWSGAENYPNSNLAVKCPWTSLFSV